MADLTTRPSATTVADADLLYLHQGGISKKITADIFRLLTGLQGAWDMTPSTADAAPGGSATEAASVENAPHDFDLVPSSGAQQIKMLISTGPISFPVSAQSARIRVPTASAGDLPLAGLLLVNAGATGPDIAASLLGALTGTCTHLASVLLDVAGIIPGGALKVFTRVADPTQSATQVLVSSGGIIAGDEIHVSMLPSGSVEVVVNAGAPVATTALLESTPMRVVVLGYYASAATPVGNVNFDFADNTSGRTGFTAQSDPALPAGATNGKRYLVSVGGSFGGRATAAGDVAELISGMTSIAVTQADPVTVHDVADAVAAGISPAWVDVSAFSSGWQNRGSPYQSGQYRKAGDTVEIRGMLELGTSTILFNLPVGYRPMAQQPIQVTVLGVGDTVIPAEAIVDIDGDVKIQYGFTGVEKIGFNFSFSVTA